MPSVRDITFKLLRQLEMTHIFGNPGSTELPMFRDFPEDFSYILGLQESAVVGMADGYAQATGKPALVNLHSSAGVGHALGNVFTAFRNQTPLVITAGQQARSILPFDPFLFNERATEFPRPFVKWACEPSRAQDVPAAIARAWHIARQPPCGPTFVSIPIDDWDREGEPFAAHEMSRANPGDPSFLARAAAMLNAAVNPCIVVGAGVARDRAWPAVIDLAERHEALVWTAPMSARNGFPEDHRLFAGFLPAMREKIVAVLAAHDFILALGGPLSLYHVEGFGPHLPPGARIVLIGDNEQHAAWAPCDIAIVARTDLAVAKLLELGDPPARPAARGRTPTPAPDTRALTDELVLHHLARLRPADSIIVEEAPGRRGVMQDHLPIVTPDTFFTCASGGLGHGLPAAVGIALGRPETRIVALLGDGSSMYAIQALWSAAELALPISFVILNNRRYEALRSFGRLFGMQRVEGTDLAGLDFVQLAEGQGVSARRVLRPEDVEEALRWTFSLPGPSLVEMAVD